MGPGTDDPYAPPDADLEGGATGDLREVAEVVGSTGPWALFLSVLLFLGTAFLVCGGIGVGGMGLFSDAFGSDAPEGLPGGAFALVIMALYLLMGAFYGVFAFRLMRFSQAAKRFRGSVEVADLLDAAREQRAFWRLAGWTAIATFGLYVLFILGAAIVGVASGM